MTSPFRIAQMTGYARAEVRPGDAAWWFEQAARYRWTYARTMPQAPHYYIWRGREIVPDDYDRMFGALRTFGQPGKYWSRTQLYLTDPANGYRYWLMDRHFYTCLILNRAIDGVDYGAQNAPITAADGWSEYDSIAPWWDDVYRDVDRSDEVALWRLVTENCRVPLPTVLDLGAGTGGTLDAKFTPSGKVTVVDPSQGMLNDLVLKYPQVGHVHPTTVAGYLDQQIRMRHDVAVASYGSASYLTPDEITRSLREITSLAVLAFYRTTPTHRAEMPPTHDAALAAALALPGAVATDRGNYIYVLARPS